MTRTNSVNSNNSRIRIAIQKSGRLTDQSISLLKQAGLKFDWRKESLFTSCRNFPIDLMLLRDDDIPEYLFDGICDLGIVGLNVLKEKQLYKKDNSSETVHPPIILKELGFGKCNLSLAIPAVEDFQDISQFQGLNIATSYPYLLKDFLAQNKIDANIIEISGSVEIAPTLKIAGAICDLVSTGTTLKSNGLKAVVNILNSESVLAQTASPLLAEKKEIIDRLMKRVNGVILASETKYIMMNAPKNSLEKIKEIVPGMEEPSVMPLSNDFSRIAIHAVVKENVFWETMETLKEAGASSILVLPIEKIVL